MAFPGNVNSNSGSKRERNNRQKKNEYKSKTFESGNFVFELKNISDRQQKLVNLC
jgi:hypothetical protein